MIYFICRYRNNVYEDILNEKTFIMSHTTGKRGPLKNESSVNKLMYACKVCSKPIRGDELKNHYNAKVDFDKLEKLKTVSDSKARDSINSIENEEKKSHTQFFYDMVHERRHSHLQIP